MERPFWDGRGNLEEYEGVLPDGTRLRGIALRLYDPKAARWTIHWSNGANGTLDPVMTGVFRDGRGEFYSHEDYQGRMILVRFFWSSSGPDAARWEQAFSGDAGRTWQTNWVMDFSRVTEVCCPVVELRQYTLHPGGRERLIELFDGKFIEPQEAAGMRVIGQFRDLDRPDVFTWLRGFHDMPSRAAALQAFYGGPVWTANRDSANATMVSSDNVRLLRPARARLRLGPPGESRGRGRSRDAVRTDGRNDLYPAAPGSGGLSGFFETDVAPPLVRAGSRPLAMFETEPAANTFPRLPVREGERAFVWLASYPDRAAHDRAVRALEQDREWQGRGETALARKLIAPVETWRLTPTSRSRLR